MATAALVVTAVAATGSAVAQRQAARAQNKANRKARRVERRVSEIESARRARRAVAARRLQAADLQAQTAAAGFGSSSVTGAIGALTTQTAANTGAANLVSGARLAQGDILARGNRRAARAQSIASFFDAAATVGGAIASQPRPAGPIGAIQQSGSSFTGDIFTRSEINRTA